MKSNYEQIILGSSSIYRAGLLKKYIPNFLTLSPDIDESPKAKDAWAKNRGAIKNLRRMMSLPD